MSVIYFFIFLFSCILGAVVGLGGGVIIRPILDAIGYHNVLNIAFLSSTAVLVMAVVSTVKKVQDGTSLNIRVAALLSVGAIVGGALGNLLLEHLVYIFYAEESVQLIQTVATIAVLFLSIYFTASDRFRYKIDSTGFYPVIGVLLGASAIFLGIAGGPINVPVFMVLFSMASKDAAAYSIVVIFFAHFIRIVTMGFTTGFGIFDLNVLFFTLPAAVVGGAVGAIISRKLTDDAVKKGFNLTMVGLILLKFYNVYTFVN